MNNIQKVILDLVIEIDEICKKYDIEYYLHNKLALYAMTSHKFAGEDYEANVIMDVKNMKKFMEAVEKEKRIDRALESMMTSDKFPGFYLRYIDKDTLCYELDTADLYQHHGIYVTIDIMKPYIKNPITRRLYMGLELGWAIINFRKHGYDYDMLFHIFSIAVKICGLNNSKKMFGFLCKIYDKEAQGAYLIRRTSIYLFRQIVYKKQLFKNTKYRELEGYKFPVPGNFDGYLSSVFDHGWRLNPPKAKLPVRANVVDADVAFSDFVKLINGTRIGEIQELHIRRRKYQQKVNKLRPILLDIAKLWTVVCRTGSRFYLWKKYMPIKNEIIQLYEEKNYKQLNSILDEYLALLADYSRSDLALCFDLDIFRIATVLLRKNGKGKVADNIVLNLPEVHKHAMQVEKMKKKLKNL